MARANGNRELSYNARFNIDEIRKNAKLGVKYIEEMSKAMKTASSGGFDAKTLSAYQAEQLKIKQQALELAKQKAEQAKAEKSASLVLQDALKQERLAREAINTQIAKNRLEQQQANQLAKEQAALQKQIANTKKPTTVSNSAAEIGKYNAGTLGTNGQVNTAFTAYLREVKKDFDAGKISAQQYVAELERYSVASMSGANVTRQQTSATQAATKSKQELAQIEALNTLRVNENNAARKIAAREAINEKGSSEQRKAALERLLAVYKRLNEEERNTSYGQRMASTIAALRVQIKGIEDQTKKMSSSSTTAIDQYKASLQRLITAYTVLSKEQKDTVAGSRLAEMIKNLREQIKGLEEDSKGSKKGIAGIFEYLKNNVTSALGAIALLTAAWTAAKSVFTHNVEISDNFTDVQRTAKLSKEEVSEFGKELKNLDTRSSLEGLLDIGFIGGRLSVPKQELEDFVKQVDELAVVLKKEFPGGAEAVAESLGKIVTIYKVTQNEGVSLGTALSKVGSTLLELAHSGPVTVKYLQDFTLGVAGTAASAKLSVPIISAYGAVLGESGQIASSAALAITRLVAGLTTKTAKYAAIAQLADSTLTVEKFTKVVNTDAKQALDLFFKGLKAGNPVATEFDGRLGSVGINTGKIMNAVKILANNQDKLADRTKVATKAFDEGISVAHNFELANNNLAASVDKLKNAAVNLTTDPNSNLANFFKGIVDGSTYAIKAISDLDEALTKTQLKKDTEIVKRDDEKRTGKGLFNSLIFGSGSTTSKEVEEARKRIMENNSKLLNEEIAGRGKTSADILASGKSELELRKLITGEINKQKIANDRLANAIAFVANPKNTGESLETVSKRINALRAAARQQSALVARLKTKVPGNSEIYGDGSLINQDDDIRTPDVLKAEIKALKAANGKLKTGSKELADGVAKLKALKKELRLALGGTDTEAVKASNQAESAAKIAAKKQKDLQEKLSEAGKKGKLEELDGDRKELAEKTAYYENLRKLAKDHNDAVDKFNKNPKNKVKRRKVDAGVLLPGESSTINVLTDNIKAEELKNSLEDQKKIYQDFEKFKTDFGAIKAQERFKDAKDRYGNLINLDQTYLEKLAEIQSKLEADPKAKGGDAGGGEYVKKQTKVLQEATKEAREEEEKGNLARLKEFQTYTDKRLAIQEEALAQASALRKQGNELEAQEAINAGLEQVKELDATHIKKMASYQKLFDFVGIRSRKSIQDAIKTYEDDLKNFKGNAQEKAKAEKELAEFKKALKSNSEQQLRDVIDQLERVGSVFADINSNVGSIASVLLNAAKSYVEIQKGIKDVKNPEKSGLEKVTAGIGIVGAAVSVAQSVFGYFKGLKAAKEAATKAMNDFQAAALKGEQDYQALLRKRELDDVSRGKTSYKAIVSQLELLKKQSPEIQKAYDKIYSAIQGGEFVNGLGYQHGTLIRKAKTWDIMASLAGSDYERLEKLYTQGKLKDQSKADFESLKALREELEKAGLSVQDLQDQLNQMLTGTSASGLADSLSQLFENGKYAAQDFADSFEDMMKKSILQSFRYKVMEDALKPFYDEYAKLFAAGTPTNDQIEDLKKQYEAIGASLGKQYQDMLTVTGTTLYGNDSSSGSSVGIIQKNVTEATASEWIGLIRSQYDNQKQQLLKTDKIVEVMTSTLKNGVAKLAVLEQIERNTYRGANNTDLLNTKLDAIIKNTGKTGSTGYDKGN